MAADPQRTEASNRTEEAAAFLLLLRAGQRYSLPDMIRVAKVRPRPFRRINPTEALRASVADPYFALVRAWAAERDALVAAYARLLPDAGNALPADAAAQLIRAVDDAAARVDRELAQVRQQFPEAFRRLDQWHRVQWVNRIRAATTIDVAMFTEPGETRGVVDNAVAWNQQMLGQVHADMRGAVTAALLGGIAIRAAATPAQRKALAGELAREAQREARTTGSPAPVPDLPESITDLLDKVLGKAKKRAARIGVDQTDKASGEMDRARRRSAGLSRFRWRHTPQQHPRVDHKARDKRVYSQSNAPNDRAGTLPFCKCWEEPLFD